MTNFFHKLSFSLSVVTAIGLFVPLSISCQTKAVDVVQFPNHLDRAPRKPLPGVLKDTITMEDLVGRWGFGHSLMLTYLDHGTGDYSHTGKSIYGFVYTIKSDGGFSYKFAARIGDRTIREWGLGTVILSGDFITFKFDAGTSDKFRFVARKTGPDGGARLSVVQVDDAPRGHTAAARLRCGHSKGYFDCIGSQEWELRVYK